MYRGCKKIREKRCVEEDSQNSWPLAFVRIPMLLYYFRILYVRTYLNKFDIKKPHFYLKREKNTFIEFS